MVQAPKQAVLVEETGAKSGDTEPVTTPAPGVTTTTVPGVAEAEEAAAIDGAEQATAQAALDESSELETFSAWSEWSSCNAACGNGVSARSKTCTGTCNSSPPTETRLCHMKLCTTTQVMTSLFVNPGALPLVLHAANDNNTFLMKMLLYDSNLDLIFTYAMIEDKPEDETPTDVLTNFFKFQMMSSLQKNNNNFGSVAPPSGQFPRPMISLKSAASAKSVENENKPIDQAKADYIIQEIVEDYLASNIVT